LDLATKEREKITTKLKDKLDYNYLYRYGKEEKELERV